MNPKMKNCKMKIVNCTPHKLCIHIGHHIRTIEPSGTIPRVETVDQPGELVDGIPVSVTQYVRTIDLPEPSSDTRYVVSQVVAANNRNRDDLLFPGKLVRDESGRPIGCHGLARLGCE